MSDNHLEQEKSQTGKTGAFAEQEQRRLLKKIGSKRAETELEAMRKELDAMLAPLSSPKNPSYHNLKRTAAQVLGESQRVRNKAITSMKKKQHKYYLQRKRETKLEMEDELSRIRQFQEEVGSNKTKNYLCQMRKTIRDHRIKLDMESHRLNEGKLSEQISRERAKESAEADKRRTTRERNARRAKARRSSSVKK